MMDIYNKWGDSAYIEREGRWMPITEGYCKTHDLQVEEDMLFGKIGEEYTKELFEGNHNIEVKTERGKWKETGNIAIEIRYKGQPSGLSTTESSIWMHLLADNDKIVGGFVLKVSQLKERVKYLLNKKYARIVMGGDDNMSQLILVPIKYIFST